MMGIFGNGIEIPLKPFFGSMGVAPPPAAGRISSAPPWIHAGNIDNKEFVAGTTLLTHAYRPEERAKVQGLNEFLIAGSAALGSFSAGGVFGTLGWNALNLLVLPLLLVVASITVWYVLNRRAAAREAA